MKKILIANRGEIAIRIVRACKELGLSTVAIHSSADKDSLHAKLADESVCIGPGPSLQSYLHIPSIMSAAEITGVDAIHPGYGFLSESAEFAKVCGLYGINFIGPKPEHIETLGDKVSAKRAAIKAGVPLLPGSKGVVNSASEALEVAESIGFPIIIKASAGGGGRGMKIVREPKQLARMLQLAQNEAKIGFNNPDCFIEKYLERPRHVEVQLLADSFGNCMSVGERDCSIQRRHQKLIEEALCPVLDDKTREKLAESARNLAKTVGYESLGTAEFLYQDGEFYFMEMNTRVQVEHPVTEMISGMDLVKQQILVAAKERLPDVQPQFLGHSFECRINAEDPRTFAPWPGLVNSYHEPGGPGVRVDSLLYTNYRVPSLYDSMIAKVISYGKDREEARVRMVRALEELKIEGIRTNIPFQLAVLKDERFCKSQISTNFLQTFEW